MVVCFSFVKPGVAIIAGAGKLRVAKYEKAGRIYTLSLIAFDRANDLVCME